jgi:hypothetical protein
VLKKDEISKHLGNGAQPSNTVAKLLTREKVELPDWVKIKTKAPKPKDEPAEETPKAETPKAEAETPSESETAENA